MHPGLSDAQSNHTLRRQVGRLARPASITRPVGGGHPPRHRRPLAPPPRPRLTTSTRRRSVGPPAPPPPTLPRHPVENDQSHVLVKVRLEDKRPAARRQLDSRKLHASGRSPIGPKACRRTMFPNPSWGCTFRHQAACRYGNPGQSRPEPTCCRHLERLEPVSPTSRPREFLSAEAIKQCANGTSRADAGCPADYVAEPADSRSPLRAALTRPRPSS